LLREHLQPVLLREAGERHADGAAREKECRPLISLLTRLPPEFGQWIHYQPPARRLDAVA